MRLNGPDGVAWTKACVDHFGADIGLVKTLALDACKLGNDPHNREIPQGMPEGMPEDFGKNRSPARSRILLACAQLLFAHRKYGDPAEAFQSFNKFLRNDTR